MQLVLDTKDLKLSKKRQSFLIIYKEGTEEEKQHTLSPNKVTSIAITQNVWIAADAVRLAIKNQIPILFFDKIGKAEARLWSPYFQSIASLRRNQIQFAETPLATEWIVEILQLKAAHQIKNLQYLKNRVKAQNEQLSKAISYIKQKSKQLEDYNKQPISEVRNSIMGVEGTMARYYFQAISASLPTEYQFENRNRRPAKDKFNAVLNYMYGMLYSVVEGALFGAGLDPHLGFLHADEYNKPVLAFDLIEPFRPWVDRIVIELCLENQLLNSFFTGNQHGLFLNKNGKALIIPTFNEWQRQTKRFNQRDATHRNQIYHTAGLLASRLRTFDKLEDNQNEV
jgi:CRISPR-associated protein Cas1